MAANLALNDKEHSTHAVMGGTRVHSQLYSMLPSSRTGPVFVQKELYSLIFVGHLNLRQPKNSKSKRNISAINCRFCRAF